MDNRLKRFLSLAMALIMVISMMPANVAFATETEDTEHVCVFDNELIVKEATAREAGQKTLSCTCGASKTVKICADECQWGGGHEGECEFVCSKDPYCVLNDGHDGLCEAFGGVPLTSNIETVEQLKAALEAGGEVKLAKDVALTEALTVSADKTVVLDLNGHAITLAAVSTAEYALINMGKLTVKGGTVAGICNGANGQSAAELVVESGTYTAGATDSYAVLNYGTATIKDGSFNAAGGYALRNYDSAQMNIEKAVVQGVYNTGTLNIKTGDFTSSAAGMHAVWSHAGRLTIKNGTFDNNRDTTATIKVSGTGVAEILAGTLDTDADSTVLEILDTAKVTIIDGNINDSIVVAEDAVLTVNGGSFADPDDNNNSIQGTVTVNGGTYTDANTQAFATMYAADGKIILFKNGADSVEMVKSGENMVSQVVAKIGSTGYPSLEKAVAAAETGDVIKLASTANLTDAIEIKKDLAITLDLNGQAVTANIADPAGEISGAIVVRKDGSLTINGTGSITNIGGNALANFGALTVNGGTITGNYALYNGSFFATGATAVLNGGKFQPVTEGDYAVANCGKMKLTGATVADWLSTSGVFEMTGGEVAYLTAPGAEVNPADGISTLITGGKITYLESSDYPGTKFGNVITVKGTAEVAEVQAAKQQGAETLSVIKIEDGRFDSVGTYQFDSSYEEIAGSSVDGAMVITGGTYTDRPDDVYVKTGYETVEKPIEGGVVYIVRLKKVDLEDPSDPSSFVTNNGAAATVTYSQILDDIKANESYKTVTNESGYTLIITPKHIVIEAGDPYQTSKITYSVSPVDLIGNKIPNPGKEITFNLPVPGAVPAHIEFADVYHNDAHMGKYKIEGDKATGKGYVTVKSATFSDFTVELIDINTATDVARIGVKGYASVQAAVNAVQNGQTIELLELPQNGSYGPVAIELNPGKKFTIDGADKIWADAAITVTGGAAANQAEPMVTIRNVKFTINTKSSGEFIKITGNNNYNNVLIQDCTFAGPGSSSAMVAVKLNGANGVVINGGKSSNLKALLSNTAGANLTVKNVTIENTNVGMELGAVQGVTVEGVVITSTVGKYGIGMDASVNNNAVFTSCTITAAVPVMVYNTTAHGRIAFNGTSTMTANSGYWIILADGKYSEMPADTDVEALTTTGRIVITANDAGLTAERINDKYQDGKKYYTVAPKGSMESSVVFDGDGTKDSYISCEVEELVASERIEVWVYDADGKVLSVTKLAKPEYLYYDAFSIPVEVSRNSSTWDTEWEHVPVYFNVPDTAELVVDGKHMGKVEVEMYRSDFPEEKRIWTDVEGVGNLTLTAGEKTTWHHSLAEALAAAPEKDGLIKLYKDNKAVLSAAGEVTGGKTVTVTGEATFDWDQDWLYIGRGENPGDGTLIFDKAIIHAYGDGDDTGFNVSGAKKGAPNTNNGELKIINGSKIEVDFFVNRNHVELDGGSTLTVKHGFHVNGRDASETPDGSDATAVVDVMDGSVLTVQKAVRAILGEEGHGELNVDNATFNCEADLFEIVDKSGTQVNVSGTSTLNIKKIAGKAIDLMDEVVIKDSNVGGAAVASGTKEKACNVTFTGKNTFGDVTVTNGTVNVNGNFTVNNLLVAGTLNTNTESIITAKKIIMDSDDDKLVIDATNLTNEAGAKVIDLSGDADSKSLMNSTRVYVKDNLAAKRVADDGDVYVYYEAYIDKNSNGKLDTGDKGYKTLAEAVAAAENKQTIILLANTKTEETIEIKKSIALKLNHYAVEGKTPLLVNAAGVTIADGKVLATEVGIAVEEKAELTLAGVTVKATEIGVLTAGNVTITGQTDVKGTDEVNTGYGLALIGSGKTVVKDGMISGSGEIAVPVFGGTLEIVGGTVDGGQGIAIATICYDDTLCAKTEVKVSGGNVNGVIYVTEADEMPEGYSSAVTITGGKFTNNELYAAGEINTIEVSGGTFDKFVPLRLCAPDYTCRKIKDSSPVMYEVVPYEHVRIFLNQADADNKVVVGGTAYADGEPFEVQPGKVLLVTKELAKKSVMFITTYTYETKGNDDPTDDYPNAMYVWLAEGKDKKGDIYTSYTVKRIEKLDDFFMYNGTSIRVGGSKNGIRFISSVDAVDADKLMDGKFFAEADGTLYKAEMTKTGTQFWKTPTKKVKSEVYGGAAGSRFRVYKYVDGRNRFTGVLVDLDTSAETVVASIYSRPYADITIGGQTVTLYGGILDRSIHYVATQVDQAGSFKNYPTYDAFVKNLIKMGDEYLASLTPGSGGTD